MEEQVRSSIFSPVFKCWTDMNRSLAEAWDWEDSPWWCGEQAAVGLFASAVWQAGGQALAEYESPKTLLRSRYIGRGDLCFVFDGHYYVAEAKYRCPSLGGRGQSAVELLEADMEESCRDVRRASSDEERRLGMAFMAPCVAASHATGVNEIVGNLQEKLLGADVQHLAWLFPTGARNLRAEDGYIYPGAVLAICEEGRHA